MMAPVSDLTLALSCNPFTRSALPMSRLATAVVVFCLTRGGCSSPAFSALDFAHACKQQLHPRHKAEREHVKL